MREKKIADSSLQMSQMIYNKAFKAVHNLSLYADIDSEMPFIHYILFKASVKRRQHVFYRTTYGYLQFAVLYINAVNHSHST